MRRAYSRIISDEGATAIEYAIMAGFIAAVIVGAVAAVGLGTLRLFQSVPPF